MGEFARVGPGPATARAAHVAALDGLRGVAVAAVVAYHLRPDWVPGGYLGVDLFFVLSGYLITSLLLDERAGRGSIGLLAFAGRRFRRLLPAVVLVVLAVAVWAALDGDPGQLERVRRHGIATLAYVANWVFIADGDSYFADIVGPSPLRHVWSLAIEEQFYLLWPASVAVLARWGGRRAVGIGAVVVAVASAIWMAIVFDGGDPSRVYFGTDTRIFEPLIGAAVAVVLPLWGQRHGAWAWVGPPALAAWAVVVLAVDDAWTGFYRGGAVAVGLVAAVVVVAATAGHGLLVRALGWRPLVALGVISYGVYLWHWPLIVIARDRGWTGGGADLGVLAVTLLASVVSYRLVERPIRRARRGDTSWRPVGAGLAAVGVAVVGVVVLTRPPEVSSSATTVDEVLADLTEPEREAPGGETGGVEADGSATSRADGGPITVVLVGDSTAWTLGGGTVGWGVDHGPYESPFDPDEIVLVNLARKGYRLVPGATTDVAGVRERSPDDLETEAWWRATVAELQPDVVLVHLGFADTQSRQLDDGRTVEFESDAFADLVDEAATALLGDLARSAPVLIASAAPLLADDMPEPRMADYFAEHGVTRIARLNHLLEGFAADRTEVRFADLGGWLCPTASTCRSSADGGDTRFDGLHFDLDGARTAATWLRTPLLETVGPAAGT